jgi:hypothetical protein
VGTTKKPSQKMLRARNNRISIPLTGEQEIILKVVLMLYTTDQIAKLCDVPYWKVEYAHRTGRIPEPQRVAGRRVYDDASADAVRQYFAHTLQFRPDKEVNHDKVA